MFYPGDGYKQIYLRAYFFWLNVDTAHPKRSARFLDNYSWNSWAVL